MTDFKLEPKKYEGHTEGPWSTTPFSSVVGCVITAQPNSKENTIVLGDAHREADGNLIADAPLLLAHCVKLEKDLEVNNAISLGAIKSNMELTAKNEKLKAEKAELIDVLKKIEPLAYCLATWGVKGQDVLYIVKKALNKTKDKS